MQRSNEIGVAAILVFIANTAIYTLIIIDCLLSEGIIPKVYWGVAAIIWTVVALGWFINFTFIDGKRKRNCDVGNYMLAFVSHTVLSNIIIIPLAFIPSITEDRFKDFLVLYVLTATITIFMGVNVIFKTMTSRM